MRHTLHTFVILIASTIFLIGQDSSIFWTSDSGTKKSLSEVSETKNTVELKPGSQYRFINKNAQIFNERLNESIIKKSKNKTAIIDLPMPDGTYKTFELYEQSIMAPALQEKYKAIRTYYGYGVDDPSFEARVSFHHNGIYATMKSQDGTIYIVEPLYSTGNTQHISYQAKDLMHKDFGACTAWTN